MPIYRVRNWDKFQHYKDRTPPWIRLHRALLDDYEYHCLPDASKALAPCLWLLASENDDPTCGEIRASDEKIAFRLRMPVKKFQESVKALIEHGFFDLEQDDSELLASCKQHALPETETETEEERKPKRRRVTLDELSISDIADWLAEKRSKGKYLEHDENFILDYFKNYCISKGKRYDDYIAGLRNAFEWGRCQPRQDARRGAGIPQGQNRIQPGSPSSYDNRDAASRARDIGEEIIAKRAAQRAALGSNPPQGQPARAGRADAPALPDVRQPEGLR